MPDRGQVEGGDQNQSGRGERMQGYWIGSKLPLYTTIYKCILYISIILCSYIRIDLDTP